MIRDIPIRRFRSALQARGFRADRNARDEYISTDGAIAVPAVMKAAGWARGEEAVDRRQTLLAVNTALAAAQNETPRVGAQGVG